MNILITMLLFITYYSLGNILGKGYFEGIEFIYNIIFYILAMIAIWLYIRIDNNF